MDYISFIPNICEGFPFKKGDYVLLNFWGDNEDLEVLDLIAENLSKKGILSFKNHCSKRYLDNEVVPLINNNERISHNFLEYLTSFEYAVDIFMYKPSLPKSISKKYIHKFKEYLMNLFHAVSNNKTYYIQINVPTRINALDAGVEYDLYKDSFCKAISVDFNKLKKSCNDTIENLKGINNIEILTGEKYSLKFSIFNRQWHADHGCGDFPPGEVYIAPLEDSAHGDLLIPLINLKGLKYENIIMSFKDGKFIKSSSKELNDFFHSLPEEYKILCEFGIGLNPEIKNLIGYTPIDEKALGTYHIALGMNHLFGGKNNCPFHMDFVFNCDHIIYS